MILSYLRKAFQCLTQSAGLDATLSHSRFCKSGNLLSNAYVNRQSQILHCTYHGPVNRGPEAACQNVLTGSFELFSDS